MSAATHAMIPGSHERPGGPECRCGAAWYYWGGECASSPEPEPQPTPLHDAADSGATVTIALEDGRLLTGTAHPHRTEPGYYVLRNGRRGRPPVFHEDDVEEVVFE